MPLCVTSSFLTFLGEHLLRYTLWYETPMRMRGRTHVVTSPLPDGLEP